MRDRIVILWETIDADVHVNLVNPGCYGLPETRKMYVRKLLYLK